MREEEVGGGTGGEEVEVVLVAAEVGELGKEVEVALVFAGKEEEEGVDGLAVEGAVVNGGGGEDDCDDVEVFVNEEIAGVGDADAVVKASWHELFPINQQIIEDSGIPAKFVC